MKRRIKDELGLPASVGIAISKVVARKGALLPDTPAHRQTAGDG